MNALAVCVFALIMALIGFGIGLFTGRHLFLSTSPTDGDFSAAAATQQLATDTVSVSSIVSVAKTEAVVSGTSAFLTSSTTSTQIALGHTPSSASAVSTKQTVTIPPTRAPLAATPTPVPPPQGVPISEEGHNMFVSSPLVGGDVDHGNGMYFSSLYSCR